MYDVEQAVQEIDKAIQFGYERANPMSIAKLLELKSKLYGLLIEKIEVVTVDITAALAEAKHRAGRIVNPLELSGPNGINPFE